MVSMKAIIVYTRYKSSRKRRDDSLFSSPTDMDSSNGRKNTQAVNIVLHDTPSSH